MKQSCTPVNVRFVSSVILSTLINYFLKHWKLEILKMYLCLKLKCEQVDIKLVIVYFWKKCHI